MMRSRSVFEICLPALLLVAACLLSMSTFILAMLWMFAGAVSVGHRDIRSFPSEGVPYRWHRGWRSAFLTVYHLAWWPRYMRAELEDFARRLAAKLKLERLVSREKAAQRETKTGQDDGE